MAMAQDDLAARVREIRERIDAARTAGGWSHPVRIIAVTKTHGPEAVEAAVRAGLDAVGENRVQEALAKQEALPHLSVEWHLIGSLQTNKAKQVVGRFALIHSVDRLELAQALDRRAAALGVRQPVLVQVNGSREPQKGGVEPEALPGLLDQLRACPHLEVRGLMTMAALSDDPTVQRSAFALVRGLRDAAVREGHVLPELSMGMSGDYAVAVEEGATMVRLGSVLFGERG